MVTDSDDVVIIAIIGSLALLFTAITYISEANKLDCVVQMSKLHSDWHVEELQKACE